MRTKITLSRHVRCSKDKSQLPPGRQRTSLHDSGRNAACIATKKHRAITAFPEEAEFGKIHTKGFAIATVRTLRLQLQIGWVLTSVNGSVFPTRSPTLNTAIITIYVA